MKKFIALFLCLMLVMSVMPVAFAAGEWTGTGVEGDPYVISDVEGLQKLADDVLGGNTYAGTYFKLGADIDMTGYSFQIGKKTWDNNDAYFSGSFDGAGFTVSNFTTWDEDGGTGLFGLVIGSDENHAVIKNLTVDGEVSGTKWIGGIVGYGQYVDIVNCVNNATIKCEDYWEYKGGIAGYVYYSTISGCTNNGELKIRHSKDRNGGIVGEAYHTTVEDCVNNGNIDVDNCYNSPSTGGIVGYADGSQVVITRCINNGNITADNGNIWNLKFLGGILGLFNGKEKSPVISQCINTGDIVDVSAVNSADSGGIVGKMMDGGYSARNTIEDCYNLGDGAVGGIVGALCRYADIRNCYSLGTNPNPGINWYDNNVSISRVYVAAESADGNISQIVAEDLTNGNLVTILNNGREGEEAVWVQGAERPELACFAVIEDVVTSATIDGVTDATVTYSVTLADEDADAVVIIALYDGNDLVAVKTVNAAETSATLSTADGADSAKIFVWESFATAKPIAIDEYTIAE